MATLGEWLDAIEPGYGMMYANIFEKSMGLDSVDDIIRGSGAINARSFEELLEVGVDQEAIRKIRLKLGVNADAVREPNSGPADGEEEALGGFGDERHSEDKATGITNEVWAADAAVDRPASLLGGAKRRSSIYTGIGDLDGDEGAPQDAANGSRQTQKCGIVADDVITHINNTDVSGMTLTEDDLVVADMEIGAKQAWAAAYTAESTCSALLQPKPANLDWRAGTLAQPRTRVSIVDGTEIHCGNIPESSSDSSDCSSGSEDDGYLDVLGVCSRDQSDLRKTTQPSGGGTAVEYNHNEERKGGLAVVNIRQETPLGKVGDAAVSGPHIGEGVLSEQLSAVEGASASGGQSGADVLSLAPSIVEDEVGLEAQFGEGMLAKPISAVENAAVPVQQFGEDLLSQPPSTFEDAALLASQVGEAGSSQLNGNENEPLPQSGKRPALRSVPDPRGLKGWLRGIKESLAKMTKLPRYADVVPAVERISTIDGDVEECQRIVNFISKHGCVPQELLNIAREEGTDAIGMLKASIIAVDDQADHVSSLQTYYGAAYVQTQLKPFQEKVERKKQLLNEALEKMEAWQCPPWHPGEDPAAVSIGTFKSMKPTANQQSTAKRWATLDGGLRKRLAEHGIGDLQTLLFDGTETFLHKYGFSRSEIKRLRKLFPLEHVATSGIAGTSSFETRDHTMQTAIGSLTVHEYRARNRQWPHGESGWPDLGEIAGQVTIRGIEKGEKGITVTVLLHRKRLHLFRHLDSKESQLECLSGNAGICTISQTQTQGGFGGTSIFTLSFCGDAATGELVSITLLDEAARWKRSVSGAALAAAAAAAAGVLVGGAGYPFRIIASLQKLAAGVACKFSLSNQELVLPSIDLEKGRERQHFDGFSGESESSDQARFVSTVRAYAMLNDFIEIYTPTRLERTEDLISGIMLDMDEYGKAQSSAMQNLQNRERKAKTSLPKRLVDLDTCEGGDLELKLTDPIFSDPSSLAFAAKARLVASGSSVQLYRELSDLLDTLKSQKATQKLAGLKQSKVKAGNVKKFRRMIFKTISKYGGIFSNCNDLARATITVGDLEAAIVVAEAVKKTFRVLRVKNRFVDKQDLIATPPAFDSNNTESAVDGSEDVSAWRTSEAGVVSGGYVDIQMICELNGKDGKETCEVQITLPEMLAIKSGNGSASGGGGHAFFKEARALELYSADALSYVGNLDSWSTHSSKFMDASKTGLDYERPGLQSTRFKKQHMYTVLTDPAKHRHQISADGVRKKKSKEEEELEEKIDYEARFGMTAGIAFDELQSRYLARRSVLQDTFIARTIVHLDVLLEGIEELIRDGRVSAWTLKGTSGERSLEDCLCANQDFIKELNQKAVAIMQKTVSAWKLGDFTIAGITETSNAALVDKMRVLHKDYLSKRSSPAHFKYAVDQLHLLQFTDATAAETVAATVEKMWTVATKDADGCLSQKKVNSLLSLLGELPSGIAKWTKENIWRNAKQNATVRTSPSAMGVDDATVVARLDAMNKDEFSAAVSLTVVALDVGLVNRMKLRQSESRSLSKAVKSDQINNSFKEFEMEVVSPILTLFKSVAVDSLTEYITNRSVGEASLEEVALLRAARKINDKTRMIPQIEPRKDSKITKRPGIPKQLSSASRHVNITSASRADAITF
eukprot:gene2183-34393_t